jgi:response regulator RpfG family c-di-GMP phosphodiesterase
VDNTAPESKLAADKPDDVGNPAAPSADDVLRAFTPEVRLTFAQTLLAMLDMKSPPLGAHGRRVSRWCCELGGVSGLSPEELVDAEIAGALHDIGFLIGSSRAASFVEKDEKEQTLRHPSIGFAVVSRIPGFERVSKAILHHHECFDGNGYPQKLWGQNIPLLSKIIAVADAYDRALHVEFSMIAGDLEEARRVLAKERGKSLDPDLVSKFLFILTTIDPVRRYNENEIEMSPTALRPGMVLSRDLRSISKVLLLRADTVLTQEMIDRVLSSDNYDWLVTLAYVDAESIREDLPADARHEETAIGLDLKARPVAPPEPEPHMMNVLVVDDSSAVCNALRRELGRVGMTVIGTTDVKASIHALEERSFDAIVTDLMLNGAAGGFELLRHIEQKYPSIHCVVLSGFPTSENIHALRGFGNIVRFVTKPWSKAVLTAAVREAVDRTHGRQDGSLKAEGPAT